MSYMNKPMTCHAGEPGADGLTVEANNGREFEFVGLLMQEASEGSLYDFITGL